jgi:tRNA(Ile2) C34 agmatinyltransferase TiaS
MAIWLKDLAKDPTLLDRVWTRPKPVCSKCGSDEIIGGECQDCYYDALGKLVEEHPIPSGGIRRS